MNFGSHSAFFPFKVSFYLWSFLNGRRFKCGYWESFLWKRLGAQRVNLEQKAHFSVYTPMIQTVTVAFYSRSPEDWNDGGWPLLAPAVALSGFNSDPMLLSAHARVCQSGHVGDFVSIVIREMCWKTLNCEPHADENNSCATAGSQACETRGALVHIDQIGDDWFEIECCLSTGHNHRRSVC